MIIQPQSNDNGHFHCQNCEQLYPSVEKVSGDTDICFDCFHLGGPI